MVPCPPCANKHVVLVRPAAAFGGVLTCLGARLPLASRAPPRFYKKTIVFFQEAMQRLEPFLVGPPGRRFGSRASMRVRTRGYVRVILSYFDRQPKPRAGFKQTKIGVKW